MAAPLQLYKARPVLRGRLSPSYQVLLMVVIGFVIRLVVMAFLYQEQLDPWADHFRFGYETGRLARSIVSGHGFSSPLFANTGPSAWMTPVYPAIVAVFFKVFGVYTKTAAIAILSFNALTSALTCVPIFLFAKDDFGYDAAKYAGWTWVFFPYAVYFPVERIWETWLATLLFGVLFLMLHKLKDATQLYSWAITGMLWGLAGLTSAMVLTAAPFLHAWVSFRRHRQRRNWIKPNLICAFVFLIVVSPWMVRNYRAFHRVIPFRDNMGLVLRLGTKGATDYWGPYELGPWHNPVEWQEFQREGELKYMDVKAQQAFSFIKGNPDWYIRTAFRRAVFLWTGYWSLDRGYLQQEPLDPLNTLFCSTLTILTLVGLWKAFERDPAVAVPYAITLIVFPLLYYFTSPEVYYRRPIDPFCVVLSVNAIVNLRAARKQASLPADESIDKEELAHAG